MLISVFSPKGGSGVSVTSGVLAKALSIYQTTLLIECGSGDLEAMLALEVDANYGFFDWLVSENARIETLLKISTKFSSNLALVPWDSSQQVQGNEIYDREQRFQSNTFDCNSVVDSLSSFEGHCVVDCSKGETELQKKIIEGSDVVMLVLRQCYLGLFRATQHELISNVDAVLVVKEPGRTISCEQITRTLNCSILLEVDARRDFARAIDAGVLWSRTPEKLDAPIAKYIRDLLDQGKSLGYKGKDVFEETQTRNKYEFWDDSNTAKKYEKYEKYARSLLSQDPK